MISLIAVLLQRLVLDQPSIWPIQLIQQRRNWWAVQIVPLRLLFLGLY